MINNKQHVHINDLVNKKKLKLNFLILIETEW
jgi:hypothetical protein